MWYCIKVCDQFFSAFSEGVGCGGREEAVVYNHVCGHLSTWFFKYKIKLAFEYWKVWVLSLHCTVYPIVICYNELSLLQCHHHYYYSVLLTNPLHLSFLLFFHNERKASHSIPSTCKSLIHTVLFFLLIFFFMLFRYIILNTHTYSVAAVDINAGSLWCIYSQIVYFYTLS